MQYDGDVLRAIDLHFEQRCDGQSAALTGTVRWRAGDAASPTGPVLPVPAALWRAPPGSTPTTGSYVYLDGDASLTPGIPLPRALVPAARNDVGVGGGWPTDDPRVRSDGHARDERRPSRS